MKNKRAIAASFAAAARTYDGVSEVQALSARRLTARIPTTATPRSILDIGAGTGHLAQSLSTRWPTARLALADLAPPMLAIAKAKLPTAQIVAADAENPPFPDASFDLVASNLALQWCDNLPATLKDLARLLRPGGQLAVTTLLAETWSEWRDAHETLGLTPGTLKLPTEQQLRDSLPWVDRIEVETILRPYRQGREFLRDIKRLGAGLRVGPALSPTDLRRVLCQFETAGPAASYQVATILLRRPHRPAIFIAGTDTNVGKTIVSAILAHAWAADYWKPIQTGLATDPGDTAFLKSNGITTHPPRFEFQAPLSAYGAAGPTPINLADFTLPTTQNPLIIESAGGIASPLNATLDMADLAAHLALPVILVARSGLGTINHTLLAIETARRRGLFLLGIIMVGAPNPANRAEIERRGNVSVLLECEPLQRLDPETLAAVALRVPSLAKLGWTFFAAHGWFIPC